MHHPQHQAADLRALGLTHRVIACDRVGSGTAVWLEVAPSASSVVLATQHVALAYEDVGVVNRVTTYNGGPVAVLVPANLVLQGGRQTRVVERSAVVPTNATVQRVGIDGGAAAADPAQGCRA
jgi:hypothetical protein